MASEDNTVLFTSASSASAPSVANTLRSLVSLPTQFWSKFMSHVLLIAPLILTQLLLKFQDLVDDRFVGSLGMQALGIHSAQYSFYLIGQEMGYAVATSALIFWKRKESRGKQGTILSSHLGLAFLISAGVALAINYHLPLLYHHFKIASEYWPIADPYLKLGLLNLVLRTLCIPLITMLIAADLRFRSILLLASALLFKILIEWSIVHFVWNGASDSVSVRLPLTLIAAVSATVLCTINAGAFASIIRIVDGWSRLHGRALVRVWPGELGIAAISALSPIIFSLQVARADASPSFYITYQLGLHLTCIIMLPVIAGMQIAIRDASAEHSEIVSETESPFKPLHESQWWPKFFYASLVPTIILLLIAAVFYNPIFETIYTYRIPADHRIFLCLFFIGWVFWQCGTIYLIMLRASQKNTLASRNFVIVGIFIQVGFAQVLLMLGLATPLGLAFVFLMYTTSYLILNRNAVYQKDFAATRNP